MSGRLFPTRFHGSDRFLLFEHTISCFELAFRYESVSESGPDLTEAIYENNGRIGLHMDLIFLLFDA